MKRLFLLIFVPIIFIWSCDSDDGIDNDETNVQENQEIVDETENKNLIQEPEKEQVKPVLDSEFTKFLSKFAKASLPLKMNPTGEEKYDKIPINQQVTYLSKAEDLSKEELEEMSDYTDFFFVNNPLQTDLYNAIIYARFEMGSIYYFLCTFDNDGKLISNIDFASYELIGIGPQAGQEFNTKGLIDSNNEITVKSDEKESKYKITEEGKIIEQ